MTDWASVLNLVHYPFVLFEEPVQYEMLVWGMTATNIQPSSWLYGNNFTHYINYLDDQELSFYGI
jgi:hypothetical protein